MNYLLTVGSSVLCPHGGIASAIAYSSRVLVMRVPAITTNDYFSVVGCPFCVGNAPSPCVFIKWFCPATKILIEGKPAILHNSTGICQSASLMPQGPPNIVVTQTRVAGV